MEKHKKLKKGFPARVKVGGTVYPIHWAEGLKESKIDAIGCWDRANGIALDPVLLDNADAPAIITNVLLHEIGHAIAYHYSMGMSFSPKAPTAHDPIFSEENMCEMIGTGMQQVLRDNKKLLTWMIRNL